MKVLQAAQSFFFNEKFWLADNVTWDDFKIDPDKSYSIIVVSLELMLYSLSELLVVD